MRRIAMAFSGSVLLTLVALAGACGGDSELTLAEYFTEVESLASEFTEQGEDVEQAFEETYPDDYEFESEQQEVEAVHDFYEDSVPIFRSFVDGLDDIDPPAEVADAHQAAVDAGKDALTALEDIASGLGDAETRDAAAAVFEGADFDGVSDRFTETCTELQGIADTEGIVVDLQCGDDDA